MALKRAGAALVAVAVLAGCGSKQHPATMQFQSRPDLKPPVVTVVEQTDGASDGYVFLAPKRDAPQRGLEIVDRNGQPVWFEPVAGPDQAAGDMAVPDLAPSAAGFVTPRRFVFAALGTTAAV